VPDGLVECRTDVSATLELDGQRKRVRVGETSDDLTLRAAWTEGGKSMAVLEGESLLFFLQGGLEGKGMEVVTRPFDELSSLAEEPMPRFDADYYENLLNSGEDVLAKQIRENGELNFDAVADLLPPVMDMTFLADYRSPERPIVRANWEIEGYFDSPIEFDTGDLAKHYRHGLMFGMANVLCYGMYDEQSQEGAEMIAFALADGPDGELSVYRRLRTVTPDGETVTHGCSRGGEAREVAWEFYAALFTAVVRDVKLLGTGGDIRMPEPQVQEIIDASRILGHLTFRGIFPAYGIGYYSEDRHLSFPPATIFRIWQLLEWGDLDRATRILSHYFSRRVNEDGTFDYYGPAVAEYGQMLTLAARLTQLDPFGLRWWDDYQIVIDRILNRLIALRDAAKQRDRSDVKHYGLIAGLPEADYHQQDGEWEKYYFAGDVWVCRAFREVGKVLRLSSITRERGAGLINESKDYEKDIRKAIKASIDKETGFVPAGPDEGPPFKRMTESRHASYCNYRYLLEMVSAGIATGATIRKIAAYRREHGGELLGMTRFQGHLDDWPTWHYCRGLLDIDDVNGYLMTFYGHLAHHHSRGNWASYEQVLVAPNEGESHRRCSGLAEQVLPCQVQGAIMLKHMLVDEDWDKDILYLLRACPAHWLMADEPITLNYIPTRWGMLNDMIVEWDGDVLGVGLVIDGRIPGQQPDVEIRIRLALPDRKLRKVTVHDKRCESFDANSGIVTLPAGKSRDDGCTEWDIEAEYVER